MIEDNQIGKMLTVREVADRLRIHPSTLRRWTNMGRIKAYRITPRGDRRYRREDVARFLAEMNVYERVGKKPVKLLSGDNRSPQMIAPTFGIKPYAK